MHIGTMVEFAFALVGKLDVINKHSFNDFKLRVGELHVKDTFQSKVLGNNRFFFLFFFFQLLKYFTDTILPVSVDNVRAPQ